MEVILLSVEYNNDIEDKILGHLDGWVLFEPLDTNDDQNNTDTTNTESECDMVDPFITDFTHYKNNPNKRVTMCEVEAFYEQALNKAFMLTNRLNVDDLTSIERDIFIDGVCLWTASDLWNKYNIRVNNEDMEDTYIQSYGGLLYNQAIKTLNPFINQRIFTSTSIKSKSDSNSDITFWG